MEPENFRKPAKLFAINRITGEEFEVGETTPILAPGGVIKEPPLIEEPSSYEMECVVKLKTITKKRFIKLLMSKRIQKREAIKIHVEYMKQYKIRSELGLYTFYAMRDIETSEFKIFVNGTELKMCNDGKCISEISKSN